MKQLTASLLLICTVMCYGQQESDSSSFLTRNKPIELFTNFKSIEVGQPSFQLNLPSEDEVSETPYQSDFMNFMANDTRLFNYPTSDLSDANDVVFGNYMNTSINMGKAKLNTLYIFDQNGRLVNSTASFSFGKKK